jgi:hypothetical protein
VVEEFDHLHLRTEARVDGAELQPDHARADHDHLLRHLAQRQRAFGGHDDLLVDRDPRQG